MNWLTRLRHRYLSQPLLNWMKHQLPPLSPTEQTALASGHVWWDSELFSGRPDWQRLDSLSINPLSSEEQQFLQGPVEEVCRQLDDWQINHEIYDLPAPLWDYLRQQGFFGLIIPQQYGGRGFSARAHSEVIMKMASRSITAAITVMVPNSLGPAELLLHYGTQQQKDHYLPRLAAGHEIPCFALTAPEAGSDASAIPDSGIVCRQTFNQQPHVLGIRLNWEKRYITLAPVATLLGLAFHLYDPDGLLGDKHDIGITLALIPTSHAGVEIGERHFPLAMPFQNGPTCGRDVFIPLDWVIGGREQVGNGWHMLMECLGEGRGISLPAVATGAAKVAARYTGAYARVRQQFGLPIAYFEGIEEPLARILGNTYLMDAGRILTATAIDQGQRPAVITALLKYQLTERMRQVINDAMDIAGGAGICVGPSNYLAGLYQAIPLGITVEGANILTRSMIVFGQGALRCHPFLLKEMNAAQTDDLAAFDEALRGHLRHTLGNLGRSLWYSLTKAKLAVHGSPYTRHYYRHLARLSSHFALLTDYALFSLGGNLKQHERFSGRMADILANLYLCSAVLKHFEEQGEPEADLPLLHYACDLTINRTQQAMLAAFHNLPKRWLTGILRSLMFPYGKPFSPPDDELIHAVARLAIQPSATRDRLTTGIFISNDPQDRMGRIEDALHKTLAALEVEQELRVLMKTGRVQAQTLELAIQEAKNKQLLDKFSIERLLAARKAMLNAIRVDVFPADYFQRQAHNTPARDAG